MVYRIAGGPLLFNSKKSNNQWRDNLFQKDGTPPQEFLDAIGLVAGLEPGYRQSLAHASPERCNVQTLIGSRFGEAGWTAYQRRQ